MMKSATRTFFRDTCMVAVIMTALQRVDAFTSPPSTLARRRATTFTTFVSQSTTDTIITPTKEVEPATTAATEAQKKSWTEDGFVFGLEGSGLDRPKGRVSQIVVEGDSLETTPYQRGLVSVTMAGHACFAAYAFSQMLEMNGGNVLLTSAEAMILTVSSWILADFGSGVLHWSVDNYGNGQTPVMGSIIAAFQGHHAAPWTITERGFCNNVYKLCVPFGLVPLGAISLITGPAATYFWTNFFVLEILSQEFHKWSHQLPSETPQWVNALQKLGLTVGRKPHALHHMAPYEGNYCIISGFCNPWLDESGFFRRLEHLVYKMNGVESNAWKLDPALREKTLAGQYTLPKVSSA